MAFGLARGKNGIASKKQGSCLEDPKMGLDFPLRLPFQSTRLPPTQRQTNGAGLIRSALSNSQLSDGHQAPQGQEDKDEARDPEDPLRVHLPPGAGGGGLRCMAGESNS